MVSSKASCIAFANVVLPELDTPLRTITLPSIVFPSANLSCAYVAVTFHKAELFGTAEHTDIASIYCEI